MEPAGRHGGNQPWLGVGMLFGTTALLIATMVSEPAHSVPRFTIVVLWLLTAIAAMLKEHVAYGLGDRVTLFGATLIMAVTVWSAIADYRQVGSVGAIGSLSLAGAAIVLVKVFRNVLSRSQAAAMTRDW